MTAIATSLWDGQRVRLRAISVDDAPLFHANLADSDAGRLGYEVPYLRSPEDARAWAASQSTYPAGDEMRRGIESLAGGELVGTLNTHGCDLRNGHFEYGIGIFREHWRKGYASDAIVVLRRYFFDERRYHRATATVFGFNDASIALHRHLGFTEEGRLRENVFTNGSWHDELLFGITAQEFRARHG